MPRFTEDTFRIENLTQDDLQGLQFDHPDEDCSLDEAPEASDELLRVARRISGQYVDILASFASHTFAGRATASLLAEVQFAAEALLRLARASRHTEQAKVLSALLPILTPLAHSPKRSREREAAVIALQKWVPRFAATLDPEDGDRLNRLVRWRQGRRPPLIDKLSKLDGVGPKRLQRLYAAGLYTVETLANADPLEVAQVTGLPLALAHEAVAAADTFANEQREDCLITLRDQSVRLRELLETTRVDPLDRDLAHTALEDVELVLNQLLENR